MIFDIQQNNRKTDVNIFVILLSLLIVLLLTPTRFEYINKSENIILISIALINIIYFFFTSKRAYPSWIRFETIFLIAFVIVHFQIPFFYSLGIVTEDTSIINDNIMVVNYATWLSVIVSLFWILGFLVFMKQSLYNKLYFRDNRKTLQFTNYNIPTLRIDIILFILLILFFILVGNKFLQGNYDGGQNWGKGSSYIFLVFKSLLLLRVIYFFMNNKRTIRLINLPQLLFNNKLLLVIVIIFIGVFISAGDRAEILQLFIVSAGSYGIFQKKISFQSLVLMICIGSIFFTIIRYGRTRDAYEDHSALRSGYNTLLEENLPLSPTNELASSNRILYTALDVVPDKISYSHGFIMLNESLSIIPFATRIFNEFISIPRMYMSSSLFFTFLAYGNNPTAGEGSEIISDIYINYGVYGVIILMFLFGYFISFTSFHATIKQKHIWIIIYLLMLGSSVFINRASFLSPWKDVFNVLILNLIFFNKKYSEVTHQTKIDTTIHK